MPSWDPLNRYAVGKEIELVKLEDTDSPAGDEQLIRVRIEHQYAPFTQAAVIRAVVLSAPEMMKDLLAQTVIVKLYDRTCTEDDRVGLKRDDRWTSERESAAREYWVKTDSGWVDTDYERAHDDCELDLGQTEEMYQRHCDVGC